MATVVASPVPPAAAASQQQAPRSSPPNVLHFNSHLEGTSWLSNFAPYPIKIDGQTWPTVEHYFQAMKFPSDEDYQEEIRNADSPATAKKLGGNRLRPMREDWDQVRELVMADALHAKFSQHETLKALLISTNDLILTERSDPDSFWGDGKSSRGQNRLGHLLMELREQLARSSGSVSGSSEDDDEEANPAKPKAHTGNVDKVTKRKRRNRARKNVWKDETGDSTLEIDNENPTHALVFKDASVSVPIKALPQNAKRVLRHHQYVKKFDELNMAEGVDEDEDQDQDQEEDQEVAEPHEKTLAAFLPPSSSSSSSATQGGATSTLSGSLLIAQNCINAARTSLQLMASLSPLHSDYALCHAQLKECQPLLVQFVSEPQSEELLMEMLHLLDQVNAILA